MKKHIQKSAVEQMARIVKPGKDNGSARPPDIPAHDGVPKEKKSGFFGRIFQKPEPPIFQRLSPGAFDVCDILAPASIDNRHKDYIEIDGVYHAYLYLTGYGYPAAVTNSWLMPLIEAGEGVNVSFTVKRQSKDKILNKIIQSSKISRSRMRDIEDTRLDYEEIDSAISAGMYLKEGINRYNEDLYYMHTVIEVTADDPAALERRVSYVQSLCRSRNFLCRRADYIHDMGFLSALPLLALDPDIERKARRNALTASVAAAFPFTSFELCEQNGVFVGVQMHNSSLLMIDFFNSVTYSNGNTFIAGESGMGKTYLLILLAMRLRQQGVRVILIAPLKGFEYRLACQSIGGRYIKLAPSSDDCVNVLAIRRLTLQTEDGSSQTRDDSLLADKIQKVHIFMRLRKPSITEAETHELDRALIELYNSFSITFDNGSVTDQYGNLKPMPTLRDLYALLDRREETKGLAMTLSRYAVGSAQKLGGETNISLSDFTVLDISEMPEDLLAEWMFVATDFSFDICAESRIEKKALLLDELWALIGAMSNPLAAGFVVKCFKIIRGMGGIAVGATQDLHDCFALDDGKFGKAILNNCRLKFIFPLEAEEAELAQRVLNLTDQEAERITQNERGQCLMCAGRNRVAVAVTASQAEHDLITTDRGELERRVSFTANENMY